MLCSWTLNRFKLNLLSRIGTASTGSCRWMAALRRRLLLLFQHVDNGDVTVAYPTTPIDIFLTVFFLIFAECGIFVRSSHPWHSSSSSPPLYHLLVFRAWNISAFFGEFTDLSHWRRQFAILLWIDSSPIIDWHRLHFSFFQRVRTNWDKPAVVAQLIVHLSFNDCRQLLGWKLSHVVFRAVS